MTRPTKDDVEYALEWFAQGSGPGAALAAEVRALQEELDAAKGAVLYHICLELKATIARVEALPAKWLDYVAYDSGGVPDCAKDLEDALLRKPEGL